RPHPESGRLVRAARRMAARLRAEWIVAWVESPRQPPLSPAERELLGSVLKLAEQLGADVAALSGDDVAGALMEFARERNVSRIVIGKPSHPRWRDRLRGSLLDDIVRRSGEIDVSIISGQEREPVRAGPRPPRRRSPPVHYFWAVLVTLLSTLVCRLMVGGFDRSNLIMVYLVGVAFVATRLGRGPSVLASCLGVAAFDFFFVPPHLTFAVADTQYLLTFGVMLLVGLLISTLAVQVKDQAEAARGRERRTRALYAMSRELAALRAPGEVSAVVSRHVSELFHGPAAVLLAGGGGRLAADGAALDPAFSDPRERAVAEWTLEHRRPAGLGTDTLPGAAARYLPLPGSQGVLGVLGVRPHESLQPLSRDQSDLLETLAHQAAAALDRARLAEEREKARLAAEAEELRSTLLSSVSHDLRTPLAAITGAASSLLQEPAPGPAARRELAETISDESERLNRLVTNLLDMSRLESGAVRLHREWHPFEEVVGSALARLERALAGRSVETHLAPGLPLVPMDAVLVEQLLFNLVDNAVKYSPAGSPIRLSAWREGDGLTVEVADEGPGLSSGSEERVFEKFERGEAGRGFGLGLAICRAVVTAHGGRIWVESGRPRGAAFRFSLPLGGAPPALPVEDGGEGERS
ncbi:MAG TPA: DUF4118 domain-containing protein, partial [Vicinamibacteria bacterium]|nr:DUF4118 domain-containing protein [Vicinamibacteria bacterium]